MATIVRVNLDLLVVVKWKNIKLIEECFALTLM